jgi:hypothetical protein
MADAGIVRRSFRALSIRTLITQGSRARIRLLFHPGLYCPAPLALRINVWGLTRMHFRVYLSCAANPEFGSLRFLHSGLCRRALSELDSLPPGNIKQNLRI